MKKLIALALLLAAGVARAADSNAPVLNGNTVVKAEMAQNLSFVGCQPFRVEQSTTPLLVDSGSGLLYDMQVSSGLAGDNAVAFDSASVSGMGIAGLANIPQGRAISPVVQTNPYASGSNAVNAGSFQPVNGPRYYANGLVVAANSSRTVVTGCYRDNAGANPQ